MRILLLLAFLVSCRAYGSERPRLAVFDFGLVDTSPAPTSPEELRRLERLNDQLKQALGSRYDVVPATAPKGVLSIRGCNGCELDIARGLGAEQVAYGWMQKVSNLILNINLVVEDARSGIILRAESVDIRGNTDESWTRGLRYLLNERLFRTD